MPTCLGSALAFAPIRMGAASVPMQKADGALDRSDAQMLEWNASHRVGGVDSSSATSHHILTRHQAVGSCHCPRSDDGLNKVLGGSRHHTSSCQSRGGFPSRIFPPRGVALGPGGLCLSPPKPQNASGIIAKVGVLVGAPSRPEGDINAAKPAPPPRERDTRRTAAPASRPGQSSTSHRREVR